VKNRVFVTVLLGIVVITLVYVYGVQLFINLRMPSAVLAPYVYKGWYYQDAWLWPENRILFKHGTVALSENGTLRAEVSGYWYRKGIDWLYADEAAWMRVERGRIMRRG
jgi:hypothetical protein